MLESHGNTKRKNRPVREEQRFPFALAVDLHRSHAASLDERCRCPS